MASATPLLAQTTSSGGQPDASCTAVLRSWALGWNHMLHCHPYKAFAEFFRWPCLSSGEPRAGEDPFKYSETEYHGVGHSFKSKHGNKTCKMLDEMLPLIGMGCALGYKTTVVVWDLIDLTFLDLTTSMGLVMFANDIIEWAIVMGACLMWYTFCYWSDTVHKFWKLKVWPLPSLMPGGFMPRLAAFSLGLLMFTTSTLVSEGRVEGKALLNKFDSQGWDLCRATDMEADHAATMWFSRTLRRPPSVSEKGSSFTCFNIHTHGLLWWSADELKGTNLEGMLKASPQPFNKSRLQAFFDEENSTADTLNHHVEKPYNGSAPLSHSFGFPMNDIVPVLEDFSGGGLTDANFSQYGFHCMYQCTKWKSVGLMAVIKNVGTIVAGSAVVVKTSDTISKNFGGHIWGLPLVNKDTTSATIKSIIQSTRTAPGKGRSKLWAWGVCCFAMTPLRFASKLNVDGYFTVDYYVTAVFFSSLIMACVVRQFQPYKVMRIAYTEEMWANGKDSFLDKESHTFKEIDLYEWIHLSQLARANHLVGYARKITPKDIKDELAKQKKSREAVKAQAKRENPVDLEGQDNQQEGMDKAQIQEQKEKEAKEEEKRKDMKKKYYNAHAELVVKVVQEITVSTVSPPSNGDDPDIREGIVVGKRVVVRPNSVGTIIEQVNDDRVKIRVPKEVPENPPVMENRLPRVSFEAGETRPICFKTGIPVAITDRTLKFDPDDEETSEKAFGKVQDLDLRQKFKNGTKKIERQYNMVLTPAFPKAKHKVNTWFHNIVLRTVKPQPRHLTLQADDDDYEAKSQDEATKWEDVEVSLQHIIEASDDWCKIEEERDDWMKEKKVSGAVVKDNEVAK